MPLSRLEIDEMLKRADEARLKLRKATLELQVLGQELLKNRMVGGDGRSR